MKRINIKSKRRKCLLKKAIELRYMCDLEVLVIIKDKEFKRITIYNSSDQSFHPTQVKELAKPIDHSIIDEPGRRNKKTTSYQYICNNDYHRFSHEKDNDRD